MEGSKQGNFDGKGGDLVLQASASCVATLALARDEGKGGLQGCGPISRPGSHITCSRECKECEGVNPHTPK